MLNLLKKQLKKQKNKLPDYIIACVGGGSNAMGIFYPFLKEKKVKLDIFDLKKIG